MKYRSGLNLSISINGCLDNNIFTDEEKVLLMKLGSFGEFGFSRYQGVGDVPNIDGCNSIKQICYKLNLPIDIDPLPILRSSLNYIKSRDRELINYSEKRDLLTASICIIGISRVKLVNDMIDIISRINESLSNDLLRVKKWSPRIVEDLVNKYY